MSRRRPTPYKRSLARISLFPGKLLQRKMGRRQNLRQGIKCEFIIGLYAQNQEAIVQAPDTEDLLRPVNDAVNLSASRALDEIAEIVILEQMATIPNGLDNVGKDIGKWPKNIDSNMRLLLIQRGPKIFQHININFAEESTVPRVVQPE
ncbi:hypothetical protein NPIL_656781 [Nephila pilipes]|uniref:Uncharacterized protein n=1 Tax=Nephila pilipes TaxID=299642 RepID=A0A8X6PJU7_NEPPI|nr:hypothetical protein NPIL_656781 [Nephila pilipes]